LWDTTGAAPWHDDGRARDGNAPRTGDRTLRGNGIRPASPFSASTSHRHTRACVSANHSHEVDRRSLIAATRSALFCDVRCPHARRAVWQAGDNGECLDRQTRRVEAHSRRIREPEKSDCYALIKSKGWCSIEIPAGNQSAVQLDPHVSPFLKSRIGHDHLCITHRGLGLKSFARRPWRSQASSFVQVCSARVVNPSTLFNDGVKLRGVGGLGATPCGASNATFKESCSAVSESEEALTSFSCHGVRRFGTGEMSRRAHERICPYTAR